MNLAILPVFVLLKRKNSDKNNGSFAPREKLVMGDKLQSPKKRDPPDSFKVRQSYPQKLAISFDAGIGRCESYRAKWSERDSQAQKCKAKENTHKTNRRVVTRVVGKMNEEFPDHTTKVVGLFDEGRLGFGFLCVRNGRIGVGGAGREERSNLGEPSSDEAMAVAT